MRRSNSELDQVPLRNCQWRDLILWVLQQRQRFRVAGVSMLPVLAPGEEVLVNLQAYRCALPAVGDLVIIQSPEQINLQLVKRVIAVQPNGHCFVQGDNPQQSRDSRVFGWLEPKFILGQVTSRFP